MPDHTASKAKVNISSRGGDAPSATRKANGTVIAADRYVPGLVRTVANRLEGGASRFYRKHYSIGLSEWHILVALAADPWITTAVLCANAGLDKAAVSRSLARMEEEGFCPVPQYRRTLPCGRAGGEGPAVARSNCPGRHGTRGATAGGFLT
jgi:hypothetical protein